MIASSVSRSIARSVAQAVSSIGAGGSVPFVATPSTETPVAGVAVTWTTNAGDIGTPVSYTWDFGDYTVPGSGASVPSHFWVGLGPYTVTITVTYDDDSTDTTTVVITPTTPAATSGQTLIESATFSTDLTDANYNTTYSFDVKAGTVAGKSIPVGAKLAATSGVGWHVEDAELNWRVGWNIGIPSSTGLKHQATVWIYSEQAPASGGIGVITYSLTYEAKISIENDGSITLRNYADTILHTYFPAGSAPVGEWFALSSANDATFITVTLRTSDGVSQDSYNYAALMDFDMAINIGPYHLNGNQNHRTRFSFPTLHTLTSIANAGYPGEVVPPQTANHIFNVNPDTGDDTNDGASAPWETVDRVNSMFGDHGVVVDYTQNSNGSGNHLVIDTSTEQLAVTDTPLILRVSGTWLRPPDGGWINIKPYRDGMTWTLTGGGHTDVWETSFSELYATNVFGNDIPFEPVASLAALDSESGGASFSDVAGSKLYIKTLALGNPNSDGITYRHGRYRLIGADNGVGDPVIAVAGKSLRITGGDADRYGEIFYTTMASFSNPLGCYAIGDVTGFDEGCLVEYWYALYGDKHIFCWTANATNTTITMRNWRAEQANAAPITDFMFTGSGNVHNWENGRIDKSILVYRSSAGMNFTYGTGAWYCHGTGACFDSVNFVNCSLAGLELEGNAALLVTFDGQCDVSWMFMCAQDVTPAGIVTIAAGATLSEIPSVRSEDSVIDGAILTADTESIPVLVIAGEVKNSTLDFRNVPNSGAIWGIFNPLTFTNNTVRLPAAGGLALFHDCAAADFVSWTGGTIYIGASDVLVADFDDGVTTEDRTFADMVALGYLAGTTRLDP